MTDPLRVSFDVACPPDRAFALWTGRIDTWWPADHTVTGGHDLTVVLEPGVGGRIFERTPEGVEHDWGEVTVWEPPGRLGYPGTSAVTVATPPRCRSASSPGRRPAPGWRSSTPGGSGWVPTPTPGGPATSSAGTTLVPHFAAAPSTDAPTTEEDRL